LLQRHKQLNITEDVYERLKGAGKFGESFSDVISRALDALEKSR
jgi:predicted CopG family antitoxin